MYRDKSAKTANPFRPTSDWGPKNPQLFEKYQKYVSTYEEQQRLLPPASPLVRMKRHIFGWTLQSNHLFYIETFQSLKINEKETFTNSPS